MNLEEERDALQRLVQQTGYQEACERLKRITEECAGVLRDIVEQLRELLTNVLDAMSTSWEELVKLAEEGMAVPDGREWQRDREREAIPREQARAAARYKAHRRMMTEHKARQHLRRRKYRSGANAGWY